MITVSDMIHLPYGFDLSQAGSAYACRWLACSYERPGDLAGQRLCRIAGDVAVELALRRYLAAQGLPFQVQTATPFSRIEHYDLRLGGHRCILESNLITRPSQVKHLLQQPELIFQAPALVPMDAFVGEAGLPEDILLFAFPMGEPAAAQRDLAKVRAAGQPLFLVHPLPESWARPQVWLPLDKAVLKSESGKHLPVKLGGLDAERNYKTLHLDLLPGQRLPVGQTFHSLAYVHALDFPEARLGLHSSREKKAYIIQPGDWKNIWIQGRDILLAGWMTRADFRRNATVLNAGTPTFLYEHTHVKNLMIPLLNLNPLRLLFEKLRVGQSVIET